MKRKEEFLSLFPMEMRNKWEVVGERIKAVEEIRLRIHQPICIWIKGKEYFLSESGALKERKEEASLMSEREMKQLVNHICDYSLYAYENELRQGYLTVEGGHRIGIVGKAIVEQGKVKNITYISGMNIRIAHQIIGAANAVLPFLYQNETLQNCLIISPPGGGKTTLLRDIVRQVSDGNTFGRGMNVCVVDERSEIGGSYLGIPQNDLGMRTDVLDACPKAEGMMMLVRAMSPKMLAIDEVGGREDIRALEQVLQCGCKVIATIHGASLQEVQEKEAFKAILEKQVFRRYVVLSGKDRAGSIEGIYNEEFKPC